MRKTPCNRRSGALGSCSEMVMSDWAAGKLLSPGQPQGWMWGGWVATTIAIIAIITVVSCVSIVAVRSLRAIRIGGRTGRRCRGRDAHWFRPRNGRL